MGDIHAIRLKKDVKLYLQETFTARFHCEPVEQVGSSKKKRKRAAVSENTELRRYKTLLNILATPPGYTTLRVNTLLYTNLQVKKRVEEQLQKMYTTRSLGPPECVFHPLIPDLLIMKNRGPRTNLPRFPKEVIVDLACGMAVLRGADVFAQGIMGAASLMAAGNDVSVYADVEGHCKKGLMQQFQGKKLFIGNGKAMVSRKELFAGRDRKISGLAIRMTDGLYDAPSLSGFLESDVFPQNLPSIVCSHVLDPQPGETILDMCAAPGGKTTHIATLMKNKGRVVAIDRSVDKLGRIKKNAENLNLSIIETYKYDSTTAFVKGAVQGPKPPYPEATFDRILLDGPCSALGQRPCLVNQIQLKEVRSFPALQRKLFRTAYELLRSGGTLVYSTCTIPMQENECLVQWALEEYPAMQLMEQYPLIGCEGYHGSRLPEDSLPLVQRFDPSLETDPERLQFMKPDKATVPSHLGGGIPAQKKWESMTDNGASWNSVGEEDTLLKQEAIGTCTCYTAPGSECLRHSHLYKTFSNPQELTAQDSELNGKWDESDWKKCETDTIGFFIAKFVKTWW